MWSGERMITGTGKYGGETSIATTIRHEGTIHTYNGGYGSGSYSGITRVPAPCGVVGAIPTVTRIWLYYCNDGDARQQGSPVLKRASASQLHAPGRSADDKILLYQVSKPIRCHADRDESRDRTSGLSAEQRGPSSDPSLTPTAGSLPTSAPAAAPGARGCYRNCPGKHSASPRPWLPGCFPAVNERMRCQTTPRGDP